MNFDSYERKLTNLLKEEGILMPSLETFSFVSTEDEDGKRVTHFGFYDETGVFHLLKEMGNTKYYPHLFLLDEKESQKEANLLKKALENP